VNLVITNRCDLSCWYCFFYAEKAGYVFEPSLDQIGYMIDQLKLREKTMVIQVTGGEPTLREDIVKVVKLLREKGVKHIQLNTWGGTFAKLYMEDPEKAVRFARELREAGVNTVYMSFDGTTRKTNPRTTGRSPTPSRSSEGLE